MEYEAATRSRTLFGSGRIGAGAQWAVRLSADCGFLSLSYHRICKYCPVLTEHTVVVAEACGGEVPVLLSQVILRILNMRGSQGKVPLPFLVSQISISTPNPYNTAQHQVKGFDISQKPCLLLDIQQLQNERRTRMEGR